MKRRDFLKGTMTSLLLTGCTNSSNQANYIGNIVPSAVQASLKKVGPSKVAIIPATSYEEDLFSLLKTYARQVDMPDFRGKRVVIKPNMVEYQNGKPITSHPAMIKAAFQLLDYLGAREIMIAEGPGHMRDTAFLLAATGIGQACSDLGVKFIDLNLDDLEKMPIKEAFSGLPYFYLPKTIVEADAVISLPKMKTHHWVGMTATMKNLFGTVPGRKYGYPKNLLHVRGIPNCIIDLNRIIRPKLGIVDAIVAMEGDGPINGTPKETKFMVLGTDLAAIDATCARTMKIDPQELAYLVLAEKVIGNIETTNIEMVGEPIARVEQEFARPLTFKDKSLLANVGQQAS